MICYKKNKIENSGELEMIKKMGEITKNIFNNLDEYTYKIVRVTSEKIFERCKKMIYKYIISYTFICVPSLCKSFLNIVMITSNNLIT